MRRFFFAYLGFMTVMALSVFAFIVLPEPVKRNSHCTNQVDFYSDNLVSAREMMEILNYVEFNCGIEVLSGCASIIRKNADETVDFLCVSSITLSPEEQEL
jgi:hypothetical protein